MGSNILDTAVERTPLGVHDDPHKRAYERAELDWWVAEARKALEAGLVDLATDP